MLPLEFVPRVVLPLQAHALLGTVAAQAFGMAEGTTLGYALGMLEGIMAPLATHRR
ncbi:hypothetical protein [Halomonas organivorans]|uniref:Uncharacterized protein n=1 Tax=Halomonas organivorans TaxID=257772 RepID=A0A7W5G4L3_9GAMM|nr:hypothetical protein [Halomonas organivorans]MBB3140523.1 hypothetical protein [Halomonas organivorans]